MAWAKKSACLQGPAQRVVSLLCAFVFVCIAASLIPFERAHANPSAIDYNGDAVAFYTADLHDRFGMLSNPDDDVQMSWDNGFVSMTWVPSNSRVFKGFYLNATIDDPGSWSEANFVPVSNGSLSLILPDSYCGHGWPVAPLKSEEYGGGTSDGQYYLLIPPVEKVKPPVRYVTVTFTDGFDDLIDEQEVIAGEDAVAPPDPIHKGYVFAGWNRPFTAVAQDTVIDALWMPESGNYHRVTFDNGYSGTIEIQVVEDGKGAKAPGNPEREGYAFIGWDPANFSSVKSDLTVTAQWISDDQLVVYKATQAIEALPADPKSLLRDTGNGQVAAAAEEYNALPARLQERMGDAERLKLAKCAIAVLPSDPFKVTSAHSSAITAAQEVMDSLPASLQSALDEDSVSSSRSYGRYLQSAAWALDSLRLVNNVSLLPSGTYTGQVTSTSSMGKSNSQRSIAFTVKSVMVSGGRAMAILEHGSNSSQTLRMGGIEYQNLQTDPSQRSFYEVPIALNSTFHFSVKGKNATDDTDAIVYEMTVTADESAMKPDVEGGKGSGSGGESGSAGDAESEAKGSASAGSGSGVNLNTLVSGSTSNAKSASSASAASANLGQASATVGGKTGTTVTEVDLGPGGGVVAFVVREDLMPAVAGGMMLLVSIGVLGFTLRFLRRESMRR